MPASTRRVGLRAARPPVPHSARRRPALSPLSSRTRLRPAGRRSVRLSAKPDPEAFRHCAVGLRAAPADFLFVDDREENVRAARANGMSGHVFTGQDGRTHSRPRRVAPGPMSNAARDRRHPDSLACFVNRDCFVSSVP
ncbi:HAD-IA family hydrolase [Streptomyces caeruleatus]|uniref:HAD-IA family hydrolase n=1 Tax=Streptomyces caeruleatus TaxID=661399 RepID=UPI0031338B85